MRKEESKLLDEFTVFNKLNITNPTISKLHTKLVSVELHVHVGIINKSDTNLII